MLVILTLNPFEPQVLRVAFRWSEECEKAVRCNIEHVRSEVEQLEFLQEQSLLPKILQEYYQPYANI